jgi:ribonuclease HI
MELISQPTVVIYTDGGARGNPGLAGIGGVVLLDGEVVHEFSQAIGHATNNEAEYQAFLQSLEWVLENVVKLNLTKSGKIEWRLDSKLVVEQLNKTWKIKEERLARYAMKAWGVLNNLDVAYSITHVRREENKTADRLANQAMDAATV